MPGLVDRNGAQSGPGPSYFYPNYYVYMNYTGLHVRRKLIFTSGSDFGGTRFTSNWYKRGTYVQLNKDPSSFELTTKVCDIGSISWGSTYTFGGGAVGDADTSTTYRCAAGYYSGLYTSTTTETTFVPYKLTFNTNGGTAKSGGNLYNTEHTNSNYVVVFKNSTLYNAMTSDVPTRTNYTFKGWYTAASGGTCVYYSNGNAVKGGNYWNSSGQWIYSGNVNLYAQWTGVASTVTFDANGGYTSTASKTVNYGSTYGTLPTPTRKGYTFGGWFTAASGGSQITNSTTVSITSAQTLYARWTVDSYTITYNANGGTVSEGSQSVTYGTTLSSLQIPKRSGFEFKRWYARFDGSNFLNLGRNYMYTDKISVHFDAWSDDWSRCNGSDDRLISCTETGGWNIEAQNNCIHFSAYDSGVGYNSASSSKRWDELSAGWHTFDFVFDGSKVYGYLDGELIATSSAFSSGKIGYNATNSIFVGAEPASDPTTPLGSYFSGRISNLAIRNTGSLITDAQNCFMSPAQSMNLYAEWERSSTTSVNVGGSFAPSIPYVCVDGEFKMGYAHVYDAESGEWKIGISV